MTKLMFMTLLTRKTSLTKEIDEMYKYESSDDYNRLTDEEVDLFQEHFDSLTTSLDKLEARIEYYEQFYK